jgi:CysZ protein
VGVISAFSGFITGFSYPLGAWRFLSRNKGLYKYILLPLFINIVVFGAGGYWGVSLLHDFIAGFLPESQAWYWAWLSYILTFVVTIAVLVLAFFSFTVIGNIVAAPFNDLLSEQVEKRLTGRHLQVPADMPDQLVQAVKTVRVEVQKMFVFLLGLVILFAFNIVPVLGSVIYALLAAFWTILFLAAEYTGYVFSRKGLSFKEQRRIVLNNFGLMVGFGSGIFCVLAVPFVQFVSIPLGVVGATLLVHECGLDVTGTESGKRK